MAATTRKTKNNESMDESREVENRRLVNAIVKRCFRSSVPGFFTSDQVHWPAPRDAQTFLENQRYTAGTSMLFLPSWSVVP